MKKSVIAILMTTVIVVSLMAPLISTVQAADPTDWYTEVPGVLDSDYYSLYPFEKNSLTIGFSKFGELVNPNTGNGLNYSGRDPFANEGILKQYWLQGWFADIRYIHRVFGARHLFAMATFADMVNYGGDWLNGVTNPYGAPHGGRKCSGSAASDPIQVLYNGPRRFIAVVTTHINDTTTGSSWPVLDVIFTIIFEKVKKEVIVLKDIKLTIDPKILENPVDVQFSNRGEWDLGPAPDWKSYAHFYHQELETCYGADWHLAKKILREYVYSTLTFSGNTLNLDDVTGSEPDYDVPVAWRSEYVYVNGIWMRPGIDYSINYDTGVITFAITWPADTKVEVFFKLHKMLGDAPMELPHLYDLAQVISKDSQVVGFAGFWPTLSDYSVDAWDRALEPLYVASEPDMLPIPSEPDIPFVVGEWDFMLDYDTATTDWGEQFRGVTVYGIVNYHDAKDSQMSGSPQNKIDTEVKYQLDEVFNPWDLEDAVHKDTRRWVEWYTVKTTDIGQDLNIYLKQKPVHYASVWEQYCSFSEKVMWGGALKKPLRSVYDAYDYELNVNPITGAGYINIPKAKVPAAGTEIKILYSTDTEWTKSGSIELKVSKEFTDMQKDDIAHLVGSDHDYWKDPLSVGHKITANIDLDATLKDDTGDFTYQFETTISGGAEDFKVFKGQTNKISWPHGLEYEKDEVYVLVNNLEIVWSITAPDSEDVHVHSLSWTAAISIKIEYDADTDKMTITVEVDVDYAYSESVPGRYEWGIVGRDAASVDSAGLSMVSAAFKNKQVEYGLAGADMFSPLDASGNAVNQMPWVMSKFGTGDVVADYKDTRGRAALRDDWSHAGTISGDEWAIASSNMIGVGGPLANLLAYYGNDFTDAFYGLAEYAGGSFYTRMVTGVACWDKATFSSSNTYGYAVISTYKDINGTVLFLIWGHWGRDTYYVTKWFHEEGIFQLQEAPEHLTSIIVKITYESTSEGYKPKSFSILECLGTISETLWLHNGEKKGGIHPDP